jgi:putative phosphoesterase
MRTGAPGPQTQIRVPASRNQVNRAKPLRVGLISDTHGLLRPEATAFLGGCDHILHGGDIGGPEILAQLAALAPLTAVRGNNDTQVWAASLPQTRLLELAGVRLYLIHNVDEIELDPAAAGVRVIVSGHSHRPSVHERGGIVYVNPGSAGPRRFKLPISVAELEICASIITPKLVQLRVPAK